MMRRVAVLLLASPAILGAQAAAAPRCAVGEPPPAALAGWEKRVPANAASGAAGLASATLIPGRAADVRLHPAAAVRYLSAPGKAGAGGSSGGLLGINVTTAGMYRVALGSAAWIDMVRDGAALASVAHGHGPACADIRKTVDFRLTPGAHVLQLSGAATPEVAVMLARVGN